MYVMGIDGGGSTVRVLIVDAELTVYGQAQDTGVNPKLLGDTLSAQKTQAVMRQALDQAGLQTADILAVGIGTAGAEPEWCWSTIRTVLPQTHIVYAGDCEIALVGAHGQRQGMVILAGTGCIACGISATGEMIIVGGIGYLLDDVGSGYWLGKEAIRCSVYALDKLGPPTCLINKLETAVGTTNRAELVSWMYATVKEDASAIAKLAPLVLAAAGDGDSVAQEIIEQGAQELALLGRTVMRRLHMNSDHIAFAGGLLTTTNPLSARLCALLELSAIPIPRYSPVMGAALLALQTMAGRD